MCLVFVGLLLVAALAVAGVADAHHRCGHTGPSVDPCAAAAESEPEPVLESEPEPAPEPEPEPAPTGIPADCSVDVTAELQAFLDGTPDGGTAALEPDGCYRVDGTLELSDRSSLTIDGNAATIKPGVEGDGHRAHLRLHGGTNWAINDLTIHGSNPYGAVHTWEMQWQHAIDMRGVQGATFTRVHAQDVYGDSFYVGKHTTTGQPSRDVQIIDSSGQRTGRVAGVAVVSAERVTLTGGYYAMAGLNVFDVEPNPGDTVADVVIENAEIGPWPQRQWNVSLIGPPGEGTATVRDVTIRNNRFTGSPMTVMANMDEDQRLSNVRVEGNTSTVTYEGPVASVVAHHNDGLTVVGNTQPLNGQYLVYACGSTGLDVRENTFPGGAGQLATSATC